MGNIPLISSIIIAVVGLIMGILGLFLSKKNWKFEKIDGTLKYKGRPSESEAGRTKKTKLLYKEIGVEKVKGVRGRLSFGYQIPEFYRRIAARDKQTIIHAFIVFGFFSFAVFTFFAIGIGLVNGGDENGWVFIVLTAAIVLFVVFSHLSKVRKTRK
jgi:hypothetical protein